MAPEKYSGRSFLPYSVETASCHPSSPTVVYPGCPGHSLPGMAATPVPGPTPDAVARIEAMCDYMPQIALAVNGFADRNLREWAFRTMVGLLEPDVAAGPVDVIAAPQWGDAPASAVELGRLANWIADQAPTAWRESVGPGEPTVDAAMRFLDQGAEAWTQILLVKHALMTAGGFSAEQVDGDLAPLIREMAADMPISPEIERLALYLREEAQPGESAVDVAIRLIERLRSGRPAFIPAAEVADGADGDASRPVDVGLRREPDRVDDREQAQ